MSRPSPVILDATRLRGRPPRPFCWVDPRLIKDSHIHACQPQDLALYLILLIVGNQHGISYYGEASLCRLLKIETYQLCHARRNLVETGLIAYDKPYYQVLDLGEFEAQRPPSRPRPPEVPPLVHRDDLTAEEREKVVSMLRDFRSELRRGSCGRGD